jgi:L-threonylcarbamoyladenylate synthase
VIETDVIRVDAQHPEPGKIERAARMLRDGRLVAFPTETVYGLGVHALDREAVRRLFDAKGRPATDPLIVHIASLEGLPALVDEVPEVAKVLAGRFWPGPLTLVMRRGPKVPDEVTAGLDTVAVRIPSHPIAQALIAATAVPIAAPSANLFSRPSPTRAEHVMADLGGRIDAIVDGGSTALGVESTVIDLTTWPTVLLRPGAVTLDQLRPVLGDIACPPTGASEGAMRGPGMLDKHYSPRAPLTLYAGGTPAAFARLLADAEMMSASRLRVGLLLTDEEWMQLPANHGYVVRSLGPRAAADLIAQQLYTALRELDGEDVAAILSTDVPADEGLAGAIHDRLSRAAAGRILSVPPT